MIISHWIINKMNKILDNLWLGDLNDASNLYKLKQHGITHIL